MSEVIEKRRFLLEQLDKIIADLHDVYQKLPNPDIMVYEIWTAKDVLCHLTFWHESFARNVSDLAKDIKPTPLKGKLSDLNQAGVDELRPYPLEVIIKRLQISHKIIQGNILEPKIISIPYRRGSRKYTPEEHLQIVHDHITGHLRDVVKVCNI